MQDFVFFLGRFHVLVLHLPIGMVVAAIALDWLAHRKKHQALSVAAPFLWGATAVSAVLTVALGYMHIAEGSFSGPSAGAHRIYGTVFAIVCIAAWLLSAQAPQLHRRLNVLIGVVVLALVTMTGHYGGNLTHGSEYLVEYAPQPLRTMAGRPERRPPVTDLAIADPWHDIVHPILDSRCASCHNDDKREGQLSVVDIESLMLGGETGRVIVPGNAAFSEIYRRITLPQDDESFMPADGKTPLTSAQVEILRWWIDMEAPVETTVQAVGVPADVERLLRIEVGLETSAFDAATEMAEADSEVVDALWSAGFLVRQVSQSDPRLIVSVHSVGTDLDAEQLSVLLSAADSIVSLDLQSTGLDDASLNGFSAFTGLRVLRLSENSLTDAGVAALDGLQDLEVLNLYGNAGISDAALTVLGGLESLRSVYLWRTSVSAAGLAQLRTQRPDLEIIGGTLPQ